ncbi:MAG TPA: Type 1 glutamine amidotransferase-like domain-containing protein [Armatimonadota bacterium]|jgi:cyanophycinase-like exopeptidase
MKRLLLIALIVAVAAPTFAAKKNYEYYRVGNANDTTTATTPGTVLMGGGTDVDAAFQWMCQRSGNGDFLVIRATGTDAYNPYIQQLCPGENSVATLIIPSAAGANDPFVISTIQKAEAIWIAGGDQSNYINFWKGSPVQTNLNAAIARGIPIGGTSAGMNVLTQFLYSALLSQGRDFEPGARRPVYSLHHSRPRFRQHNVLAGDHRRPALRYPRPYGS